MFSVYQQQTPVLFGCGVAAQLGDKVKELGGKKVFLVYDEGVAKAGIADRIAGILTGAELEVVTYDKIGFEAPDDAINEGAEYALANGVDCVVGLGGGSCLDASKCFAVLLKNPLPISRNYAAKVRMHLPHAPLILIPTCSGTGSEVTAVGVVHDVENNKKEGVLCYSDMAILDPELCLTAPPKVTAYTAMDAMSHAAEAYLSAWANPRADLMALDAIRRISANVERACVNGSDIEARTELALASNFAGIAFNESRVIFGHSAAHALGLEFGIPHGIGCALMLPEVLAFSDEAIPERVEDIRKALGAPDGQSAADFVRELIRKLGIPSLASMGYSRERCVSLGEMAMGDWYTALSPFPVDADKQAEVIGAAFDNYQ